MSKLGDILAELRKDKGLKQKELGKEFGVSGAAISSYETGGHLPSVDILVKYALFFDVTTDYLLGLSQVPDKLSSLSAEFVPGKTFGMIINVMDKFQPEQREALAVILDNMHFCADIAIRTEEKTKK